ncbi:MAG: hypothetical protein ACI8WB_001733 [Phenylobacterium sp.]|jgi:hypothetical protein
MSFEQDITELVKASDRLTGMVDDKIDGIDASVTQAINGIDGRVNQAESQVTSYVSDARAEAPFYRISKNQVLNGTTGSVPDHWNSNTGLTYTLVQSVIAGKQWADRTAEEQALLTVMGRVGMVYIYVNFNIWRMDWTSQGLPAGSYTMYQQVNNSTVITIAAMTKLLSGDINNYWAHGAKSEWSLTGIHSTPTPHGYQHTHPYRQTETGSLLFALPAAITGKMPLDPTLWGIFPFIGGTQND